MDEIGRGTATSEGMAIAYAALCYLHHRISCRTLFATHYHELADKLGQLSDIACYCTTLDHKDVSNDEWFQCCSMLFTNLAFINRMIVLSIYIAWSRALVPSHMVLLWLKWPVSRCMMLPLCTFCAKLRHYVDM
jgi:hypothetical protein